MPRFRLRERAKADLRAIGRYTQATWGREQRNIYLARLDASFHLLAREPHRGRACDDIRPGYRKYHVGRHLIFSGPPRRRGGLGTLSGYGVNPMMPLETQVCSRELAQRLAELGARQESVFWWVDRKVTYTGGLASQAQLRGGLAAFTVAELGEMLPNEINIPSKNGKPRAYNHWLRFGRYRVSVNACWCAYPGGTARTNLEERANTEADARAKMLIYLLENNLISHANP